MKIIVDASVILAVVLEEPARPRMIEIARGRQLAAPEVLPFEVGNALSALARRNKLTPAETDEAWVAFSAIPVELCRVDLREALKIAADQSIYAYDAYYIECALRLRVSLLTLDRSLARTAGALGLKVMGEQR